MASKNEYRIQFLRFVAMCVLLLGIVSFAWALYLYAFYPVDPTAIAQRIVFCLAMIVGGLVTRVLVPSPVARQPWLNPGNEFLGSRLDGLLLFGSILVILVLSIFTLPFLIANYRNSLASDERFVPVRVRVDSIDIKHVSAEQLPDESFYPIYTEVYLIPERYHDLWVAFGDVMLIEKDGQPVEPATLRANFTVPHSESYGSKNSRIAYVEHYRMNAVMDLERFDIGKTYQGWLLRDQPADVFFTRRSDLAWKDLKIACSLISAMIAYLILRIGFEYWTVVRPQSEARRSKRSYK